MEAFSPKVFYHLSNYQMCVCQVEWVCVFCKSTHRYKCSDLSTGMDWQAVSGVVCLPPTDTHYPEVCKRLKMEL